jgi:ubiquinone/menaquinone biosynthesis C-methylase UbiE
MGFSNCYDDVSRAAAYATLEFANTYFLAYRDLPAIVSEHLSKQIPPVRALDFGCGTGRSTRFLRQLGFDVTGVDISENMLRIAREFDPAGDYRLAPEDKLGELALGTFDLVLSAFTFDNIPHTSKVTIFGNLR